MKPTKADLLRRVFARLLALAAVISATGCASIGDSKPTPSETADAPEANADRVPATHEGAALSDIKEEIVQDQRGAAITLIGHYDLGVDKASSRDTTKVADAVQRFVLRDRKKFGLTPTDDVKFTVPRFDALTENMSVANIRQHVGQLDVLDADLTAVLIEDGSLQSLNGPIIPNSRPQARPALSLESVLMVLKRDGKAAAIGDLDGFESTSTNKWRRKDGATVEAGWSRIHGGAVWRATLPREVIWIDDGSGKVVRRQSQDDPWSDSITTLCNVRHRNWPRAADGRATSLNDTSSDTMIAEITCGGDDWLGTHYWHLKRQPSNFPHGIARVQDEDGGEKEIRQSADSTVRPSFNDSNGDALREQGAFYIVNQMRHYIKQNVWDAVAPNRDANVDLHMDEDGTPTGRFNDFFTSLHFNQSFGRQQVVMHEYGHYVVWTYDDVSDNCNPGTDEGDSLDETLANVFAELYAADSEDIRPQYGAISGFASGNGPPPHTTAASILTQNIACGNANPADGLAFQQAVWELLFNRDCTLDTSTSATSGPGNRIWVGQSQEQVIRHVGAAVGFALKALGQNITHAQVRAQMITKIRMDSGDGPANRARAVFQHHGI